MSNNFTDHLSASPSSVALTPPTSTASETETVRAPTLQGTPSSNANSLTASVVSSTVTSSSSVASSTSSSASVQNLVGSIRPSSTRAPPRPTTTPQTRISTTRNVVQPSPTPAPSPKGSSDAPSADVQVYLQAHNSVRSQHGAADLTWSDNLAAKAQQWANGCQFKHSGGSLGPFGGTRLAVTMISFHNLFP
jgi:uncharacterized protein YkwD